MRAAVVDGAGVLPRLLVRSDRQSGGTMGKNTKEDGVAGKGAAKFCTGYIEKRQVVDMCLSFSIRLA